MQRNREIVSGSDKFAKNVHMCSRLVRVNTVVMVSYELPGKLCAYLITSIDFDLYGLAEKEGGLDCRTCP